MWSKFHQILAKSVKRQLWVRASHVTLEDKIQKLELRGRGLCIYRPVKLRHQPVLRRRSRGYDVGPLEAEDVLVRKEGFAVEDWSKIWTLGCVNCTCNQNAESCSVGPIFLPIIPVDGDLPCERLLLLGEEDLDGDVVPAPLAAPHLAVTAPSDGLHRLFVIQWGVMKYGVHLYAVS